MFSAIVIATSVVVRCVEALMDIMSTQIRTCAYEMLALFPVHIGGKRFVVIIIWSANTHNSYIHRSSYLKISPNLMEAGYPKREHLYF